jgi:hypothetical protein
MLEKFAEEKTLTQEHLNELANLYDEYNQAVTGSIDSIPSIDGNETGGGNSQGGIDGGFVPSPSVGGTIGGISQESTDFGQSSGQKARLQIELASTGDHTFDSMLRDMAAGVFLEIEGEE